ncbi:WD40 repeat-like protein [Mycena venus]|uniref:WD40 repeat-like protein n=1 Tax=Mycena venus TaxID=2733690 RepID=A0A8H6XYW0_9AGAR|nr:WD40 repeat-like protein [Mycena venus]
MTLYSLSVKSVHGIEWNPGRLHGNQPNLYVKIYVDGEQIARTRTMKRTMTPKWDVNVPISSGKPTVAISLKLFHDASVLKDPCLGAINIQLDALLNLCAAKTNSEANLQLVTVEGTSKGKPSATLSVQVHNATPVHVKSAIEAAKNDVAAGELGNAQVRAGKFAAGLNEVMAKLDLIIKVGDGVSEINPYAKAAWKLLTFVYETVKDQQAMDDKTLKLAQNMVQVYSFVEDVESLPQQIKRLENVVVEITRQTLECAIFLREYIGHGFGGRLIRNTWSNSSQKVDDLSAALLKLKDVFDRGLAFETVFFSVVIKDNTDYLVQSDKLKCLNPLEMDASQHTMCLSGTRQDVLGAITEWITTPSKGSNILWLHGVAGAGKSTISTTISQYCRDLCRLGTFLFFDRNNPAGSSPGGVIRTVAYWMAMSNAHIRAAISDALTRDAALGTAPLPTQFRRLLLEPLNAASDHILGPITVILDALDECGDAESRETLVSLIVDEFPKLAPNYRFFITSRPESDIAGRFRGHSHITEMQLNITTEATRHDIVTYLHDRMENIRRFKRSLEPEWPGQHVVETLTEYSGGLFIWASTACKFIRSFDPKERLELILSAGVANNLDNLYTIALRNSADWTDTGFARDAHSVLGAVILSQMPLTDHTIDKLLQFKEGRSAQVLEYLGCVLQWSRGQAVHILHASFSDYLTDPSRSGCNAWSVNSKVQSSSLVLGCLRILNSQLKFNICKLEDSHILNVDVPDLSDRIEAHIPTELRYASSFWAQHLRDTGLDNEILAEIDDLMNIQFLYWLEVLSLLNRVPTAIQSLEITRHCVSQTDTALENLLQDGIRFLRGFSPVIAQSASHIYISALPFAPRESLIRKRFASSFPRTLDFTGPLGDKWSSLLKVFHGHSQWVRSVAISRDGTQIVSGSADQTVRIWDSETGDMILCSGHNDEVEAVAFSPGEQQIVSGGRDGFRFWDSKTGALISTVVGEGGISSIAFSPNGRELACGSSANKVQLWDLRMGAVVGEFQGHTNSVSSVAFSPDGKWIASGSADHTLRIWDIERRTLLAGPLEGHTNEIMSVAFSLDSKLIVSGSMDWTLRVWDSATGGVFAGPWDGGGWVTSVAFSPNGKQIATGSIDNTVRIWDLRTGSVVAGPFEHLGWVWTLAFSPDGRHIVSGCDDRTIRVWDAEINNLDANQVPNYTSSAFTTSISTICVSPDGQHLASGTADGRVQVFNFKTGALVAGPFNYIKCVNWVFFLPSGNQIVYGANWGELQVLDYETGAALALLEDNPWISPIAVSPDGRDVSLEDNPWISSIAVSPDGHNVVVTFEDGAIKVFNCQTGDVVVDLSKGPTKNVLNTVFSPDGKRIASCSTDHTIRIWDVETGATVVGPISGHTGSVSGIAFSPDGKHLASGSMDHTVRIWDSETGLAVSELIDEHAKWIVSVAFLPDDTRVVSGSLDMTVRVWDLKTGAVIVGPFEGHTRGVHPVAFSFNGKQVVSAADNTIRVWEIEPLDDWGSHPRFTDGWLINSASEHILWVPPWLREGLYMPWNSLVIDSRGTTKLDLSQFVHGTGWMECREPIPQQVHDDALQMAEFAD